VLAKNKIIFKNSSIFFSNPWMEIQFLFENTQKYLAKTQITPQNKKSVWDMIK
jgi:hypothetical protein